jgi:hypothetical protein
MAPHESLHQSGRRSPVDLEAELRAAIEEGWHRRREGGLSLAGQFADAFTNGAGTASDVFDLADFRSSELDRHDALLSAGVSELRAFAESELLDALLAAVLTFAREHPAAPLRVGEDAERGPADAASTHFEGVAASAGRAEWDPGAVRPDTTERAVAAAEIATILAHAIEDALERVSARRECSLAGCYLRGQLPDPNWS